MSDELAELRDRIEALESRIEQLEQQADANHSTSQGTELDHRDKAVLAVVEEMAHDPGPRGTKKLYKRKTDIRQDKTAVERAKTLRQKEGFAEAVKE